MVRAISRQVDFSPVFKSRRVKDTYDDDVDRLAERIWTRGRGRIRSKADFNAVYASYLRDVNAGHDRGLQDKVFMSLRKRHSKVKESITTTRERSRVFVKAGDKPSPKEFRFRAMTKGKPVFARQTFVTVKGVQKLRFRDSKGRFARVLEK